jgi:hypothetical protein
LNFLAFALIYFIASFTSKMAAGYWASGDNRYSSLLTLLLLVVLVLTQRQY